MSDHTKDDQKSNIKDFKEEKSKRADKTRRSRGELYDTIAEAIAHNPFSIMPTFPLTIHIRYCPSGVEELFVERDGQVLEPVCRNVLEREVFNYCIAVANRVDEKEAYIYNQDFRIAAVDAAKVLTGAIYKITPLDDKKVALVRWKDEPGLCYHRLPWERRSDYVADGMPAWESVIARLSQPEAVVKWFGTIMAKTVRNHQYLWIYGSGGEGKSTIGKAFEMTFGPVFSSENSPGKGDSRFATAFLRKKALVVYPDESSADYIKSGTFRQITGGDPVRMERKRGNVWTETLACRCMFLSNTSPEIDETRGTQRRMIYSEMQPHEGDNDPAFVEKLYREMGAFLNHCTNEFEYDHPRGGAISTAVAVTEKIKRQSNAFFYAVFDANFKPDPTGYVLASDFKEIAKICFGSDQKEYRRFLKWVRLEHDCKTHELRRIDGKPCRVVEGISPNYDDMESMYSLWGTKERNKKADQLQDKRINSVFG